MKYFRVHLGYEKSFSIPETELEKVLYLHATKKTGILTGRSVNGTYISLIEPDFHEAMGWNEGYKLEAEDLKEIRQAGIEDEFKLVLEAATEKVKLAVTTGNMAALSGGEELKKLT